jgi:hypothetical protein
MCKRYVETYVIYIELPRVVLVTLIVRNTIEGDDANPFAGVSLCDHVIS